MRRRLVVPVVLLLLSVGCSNKEQAADSAAAGADVAASRGAAMQAAADAEGVAAPAAPAAVAEATAAAAVAAAKSNTTGPGVDPDAMGSAAMTQNVGTRRFIRTAQVDAQVRDVQRAVIRITDLAAAQGGFVTRDDVTTSIDRVETRPLGNERLVELSTYTMRGDLQVRVPSDRAQMFLRSVAGELEFLDRRHYEALDARFELLRRELTRRRHDQAQAAMGDAAAQNGKIADKADAIERRADQQTARDEAIVEQRTYEDRVEFATLEFNLRQAQLVRRAERPDVDAILRHERPNLLARLSTAIADGGRGLLDLLVTLVAVWPLWLSLAIVVAAVRAWKRRSRHA
ncbi:DUF4349 domain-containing protein [Lysobacter sp. TY2-98]|uniref:DUF4349 domain-containing protein n=1 Tax=Lysobacter sp. TY2-98 TaxID=2290922 RepID=UPI000E205887|nr:DUF4349 domain-containing protein [Lysobacter sp. TY2-98]AXK73328.1 DUF4349 domain-containing protein [Lysobacter sp. TY2-98]